MDRCESSEPISARLAQVAAAGHASAAGPHTQSDGDASFPTHVLFCTGQNPHGVLSANLNAGGQRDLMISNAADSNAMVILDVATLLSLGGCPPECATLETAELLCESEGTFSWTFTFTNDSGSDASMLILPDAVFSQNVLLLSPPVTTGSNSAPITVTIAGAAPGTELCFDFILADIEGNECCHLEPCIVMPECVCAQLSDVDVVATPTPGTFELSFTFTNLSATTSAHLVFASSDATFAPPIVDIPATPTYGTQSIGPITVTSDALPGSDFCFVLGNHAANWIECCFIEPCVTIPDPAPVNGNPADSNGDGVVDGADLGTLLGNWGGSGEGDLNEDGVVDSADLGLLLGAWG